MFNDIKYDVETVPINLKTTKTHVAIIVLAVLSTLMLISIIVVIVMEVTKNNKTTPSNVDSFTVVIVDDGKDRVGVMTNLVKRYFKLEYELVIAVTAHGVTTMSQIDNATLVNVNTAQNPNDVFLYFMREGVPQNTTNWIFLGDNVIPQHNIHAGDFFLNEMSKFVNMVQVDDVLFSTHEIPPSAPTVAMSNMALPFVQKLLDVKLFMGTSTNFIYAPSNNQIVVLVDNQGLNDLNIAVKKTPSEKFLSLFVGSSVPSEKQPGLSSQITELMLSKL